MNKLPAFTRTVESAVSGRVLHTSDGIDRGITVPAVLEAHFLPAFVGSSVYFHAAVGVSDVGSMWPFFPVGGVMFTDDGMTPLSIEDENHCYFSQTGQPVEFGDLDRSEILAPQDLIDSVLLAADHFGVTPWDNDTAAWAVEECTGCDYFDEFMALPVQEFPCDRS